MEIYSQQQYREDCELLTPRIAFCQALMRRIPQKYQANVIALLRAHPQVIEMHKIETCTAMLGIHWRCQAAEVPELLRLMTARSNGDITFHLGDKQPGLGMAVTLTFTIPEAVEDQA